MHSNVYGLSFSNWNPQPLEVPDTELLQLPDHLRRTYLTVTSRGECGATVVSNLTGRCRAVESNISTSLLEWDGWTNDEYQKLFIFDRSVKECKTSWKQSVWESREDLTLAEGLFIIDYALIFANQARDARYSNQKKATAHEIARLRNKLTHYSGETNLIYNNSNPEGTNKKKESWFC